MALDQSANDFETTLRDFRVALGAVCGEVRRCYPTSQSDASTCRAPGDADRTVTWTDLSPYADSLEGCLRARPDREIVNTGLRCFIGAVAIAVDCLRTCPTSAEACATMGNAASAECPRLEDLIRPCGVVAPAV